MDFSIEVPICKLTQNTHLKDCCIIDRVGSGSYANVYKILNQKSKQIFALKVIQAGKIFQRDKQNALNEIRLLASLQSPHIINYKDSFFDQQSNSLCVVLQFAEKGDLASMINESVKAGIMIEQKLIWKALVNISLGLMVMHKNKIAHRDMKPANILVTKENIFKIGDLNVSKILKKEVTKTITGTPYYMSPQIWKGKPYDQKVDIWSLGCIIYQMACGKAPFMALTKQRLKQKICIGSYAPIPKCYSSQLWEMIKLLLKLNKKLRPSAIEILQNRAVIKNYEGNLDFEIGQLQEKTDLLKTIKMKNQLKRVVFPAAQYDRSGEEDNIDLERQQQKQEEMIQKNGRTFQNLRRSSRKSVEQIKYENGRISSEVIKQRVNSTRVQNLMEKELSGVAAAKLSILFETKKKSISFFNGSNKIQKSNHRNCIQELLNKKMGSSRQKQSIKQQNGWQKQKISAHCHKRNISSRLPPLGKALKNN